MIHYVVSMNDLDMYSSNYVQDFHDIYTLNNWMITNTENNNYYNKQRLCTLMLNKLQYLHETVSYWVHGIIVNDWSLLLTFMHDMDSYVLVMLYISDFIDSDEFMYQNNDGIRQAINEDEVLSDVMLQLRIKSIQTKNWLNNNCQNTKQVGQLVRTIRDDLNFYNISSADIHHLMVCLDVYYQQSTNWNWKQIFLGFGFAVQEVHSELGTFNYLTFQDIRIFQVMLYAKSEVIRLEETVANGFANVTDTSMIITILSHVASILKDMFKSKIKMLKHLLGMRFEYIYPINQPRPTITNIVNELRRIRACTREEIDEENWEDSFIINCHLDEIERILNEQGNRNISVDMQYKLIQMYHVITVTAYKQKIHRTHGFNRMCEYWDEMLMIIHDYIFYFILSDYIVF